MNTKNDTSVEEVKQSLEAWGAAEEHETTKDFSQALEDGDTEKVIDTEDSIKKSLAAQGLAGESVNGYEPPKHYDRWDVNTWLDKAQAKPKESNAAYDLMDYATDIIKAREQAKKELLSCLFTNPALWSLQVVSALETVELIQRHEKALQYLVENESKGKLQSIIEDNKQ